MILYYTHIIGSNSTATFAPSVVELISFAAVSWSVTVLVIIAFALLWCFGHGKEFIKDNYVLMLEVYSQATWENLSLGLSS